MGLPEDSFVFCCFNTLYKVQSRCRPWPPCQPTASTGPEPPRNCHRRSNAPKRPRRRTQRLSRAGPTSWGASQVACSGCPAPPRCALPGRRTQPQHSPASSLPTPSSWPPGQQAAFRAQPSASWEAFCTSRSGAMLYGSSCFMEDWIASNQSQSSTDGVSFGAQYATKNYPAVTGNSLGNHVDILFTARISNSTDSDVLNRQISVN